MNWKPAKEGTVRLIWKCAKCGTEYAVEPSEATVPYCSNDSCRNYQDETEFDRVEIAEPELQRKREKEAES